jgi:hypothetical protein
MLRFLAGGASALLLLVAIFVVWRSRASAEDPIPAVPPARAALAADAPAYAGPTGARSFSATAPAASEKSKEEKRFARADKDDDGKITLAELFEPRRKAFAKLDRDGNGSLSFQEWAGKTADKFAKADSDRSGWLSAREYASTAPKPRAKPKKCAC